MPAGMPLNIDTIRQQSPNEASVLDLALKAGSAIVAIYEEGCDIDSKADGSPVTKADQIAEDIILSGLKALFPETPILAEEAVEAGHLPVCGSRYFLVDPLDGTREFVNRNGEFTVNIALIENGAPVFGVVSAPAKGDIYWGGVLSGGKGPAFSGRIAGDEIENVEEILVREANLGSLTLLASRSHLCPETEAFIRRLTVGERTCVGSSLKLCWLAAGGADVYPRMGPTMQWDIAAGDAVLRAAGGMTVRSEDGAPLTYEVPDTASKSDLFNAHFIALGDRRILDHLS